jgi:hypothetical protein
MLQPLSLSNWRGWPKVFLSKLSEGTVFFFSFFSYEFFHGRTA